MHNIQWIFSTLHLFSITHKHISHLKLLVRTLSMQMVELILSIVRETRTNTKTFISSISHSLHRNRAKQKEFTDIKICCCMCIHNATREEMFIFEYMIMRQMTIIVKTFSAKYVSLCSQPTIFA